MCETNKSNDEYESKNNIFEINENQLCFSSLMKSIEEEGVKIINILTNTLISLNLCDNYGFLTILFRQFHAHVCMVFHTLIYRACSSEAREETIKNTYIDTIKLQENKINNLEKEIKNLNEIIELSLPDDSNKPKNAVRYLTIAKNMNEKAENLTKELEKEKAKNELLIVQEKKIEACIDFSKKLQNQEKNLKYQQKSIKAHEKAMKAHEGKMLDREEAIQTFKETLETHEKTLQAREKELQNCEKAIQLFKETLETLDKTMQDREEKLQDREKKLQNREEILKDNENCMQIREAILSFKETLEAIEETI